jgi:uncharacterized protein YndB with AHSA1/START domain
VSETSDKIERTIVLRASRERVWQALAVAEQLGEWFGVQFEPGAKITVGARLAAKVLYPGYEHLPFAITIERIEPNQLLAWRWIPHAQPGHAADEPTTLVELVLADTDGGTRLTVVESGFDQVPPERRLLAFRSNSGGWTEQMENIKKYVEA